MNIINKTGSTANIHLDVKDLKLRSVGQAWELVGKSVEDCDPVLRKMTVGKNIQNVAIKGMSISVIEYGF